MNNPNLLGQLKASIVVGSGVLLGSIERESSLLAQSENITVKELAFFYVEIAGLQIRTISAFCDEVNRRAENNMLKTGKLEGSHYAAMKQIRAELGA
jgi:hypothetical protein